MGIAVVCVFLILLFTFAVKSYIKRWIRHNSHPAAPDPAESKNRKRKK